LLNKVFGYKSEISAFFVELGVEIEEKTHKPQCGGQE